MKSNLLGVQPGLSAAPRADQGEIGEQTFETGFWAMKVAATAQGGTA